MEPIDKLAKEWPMIKQAPLSFFIVTAVIFFLLWVFFQWLYGERIQHKDEIISYYKEKIAITPLSQKQAEANTERWDNYKKDSIVGKTFTQERVVLDGHAFSDCTFDKVTLVYNGTAPFDLINNTMIAPIRVISDRRDIGAAFSAAEKFTEMNAAFKAGVAKPN